MRIFSGTSNKPLVQKLAQTLKINLSSLDVHTFPDGEKRIRVADVVGEDTFIVQSTATPVDQNYMELFFITDALKRSGAKSITAIIPYMGYQRQDHIFREGEAVSFAVIVKFLEAAGVDKVISFDLHSIKLPQLFHVSFLELSALPLFAEKIEKEGWKDSASVLISPDMGGIRRVKILAEMLDMPYATVVKNRDLETGKLTIGGIEGFDHYKRAIIVDDMISTGQTIVASAHFLKTKGVEEILVFATHPVFSDNAPKILAENQSIKKVFVTDTVPLSSDKLFSKLEIMTVASVISKELSK